MMCGGMNSKITDSENKLLALVHRHPGSTAGELGWRLWGDSTPAPNPGTGSAHSNKFCRAAGKLLRALKKDDLVIVLPSGKRMEWF